MAVKINERFVKTLLAEQGETVRDLAKRADMGEATLYRLMAGASFNSDTLDKLAKALDCAPADLISGDGYASPLVVAQAARNPQPALAMA